MSALLRSVLLLLLLRLRLLLLLLLLRRLTRSFGSFSSCGRGGCAKALGLPVLRSANS